MEIKNAGRRKPQWLKKNINFNNNEIKVKNIINKSNLNTVCQESRCPNIGECFSSNQATFLLLGNVCTRNCKFCNISKNQKELKLDKNEPVNVSLAVKSMGLKYVVLTSVTRDDLDDGGASVFASTIEEIKKIDKNIRIEVLVPDFKGNEKSILEILDKEINVFGHNLETVPRIFKAVREKASYRRSLEVLEFAAKKRKSIIIKSGIMVGLGEKFEEVLALMKDFYDIGGEFLTIGQYLAPTLKSFPVYEYINPEIFQNYREFGENIGIKKVIAGPFVRSSYLAENFFYKKLI
jgi:lipoyl synthase